MDTTPRILRDPVSALVLGGAGLIGSLGGAAISASSNGGKPNQSYEYFKGPDFQQGQTATNDWLNQLTQDQADPTGNFGAISPDWSDIWQQTQKQVQQYFNGTATNPGVNDQIKSSFAQRGMSADPAASFLSSMSGANEASMLNNLSAQQNIAKQQFANEGKTQWLNSIQNFQNQVANGPTGGASSIQTTPTPAQQFGNAFGAAGSAIGTAGAQAYGQGQQLSYLDSILNPGTNPSSFANSVVPNINLPFGYA